MNEKEKVNAKIYSNSGNQEVLKNVPHDAISILDIGCGSYPAFLLTVDFSEKYGLDKMAQTHVEEGIKDYGISFAN